jgi:molybdate/tungstate transport system ATP-binding protein
VIAVHDLAIKQGHFALAGISFTVPLGKYGVLMGKTGCGKSSILEAIAGLRTIATGRITLGAMDATRLRPAARGIGYVPQDAALFPTMTVREHLAFALFIRQAPENVIEPRVDELAAWLGIKHLLERRPAGLSGGEAQRVALGRALSFRPRFLLLDEPLSSLDESMREAMVDLLRDIRNQENVTVLHVTHSQREADRLAEVLIRIEDGKLCE